ncbi:MAG TPA: signal peptidase I [Egibacteraceae bacterium]|nr:signal peptidase I [Egibacteraceae bacterium]
MSAPLKTPRPDHLGWPAAVIFFVCTVYVQLMVWLALWAGLPTALGMTPTLILSDSMKPFISAGDVVVIGPVGDAPLKRGTVVTFDDPAQPGNLLTHRIVERNADGTYDTRGDANADEDSTPVKHSEIRGKGRILVPAVGIPVLWIRTKAVLPLAAWLGGLALALAYLSAQRRRLLALTGALVAAARGPWLRDPGARRPGRMRTAAPKLASVTLPALVVIVALLVPRTLASQAAFAANRPNGTNAFAAASSFCTPASFTLVATADARVEQARPTTNFGLDQALNVVSRTLNVNGGNGDHYTLVRFDLPARPAQCTMSATLRLHPTTVTAGRTLWAGRASATWAETGVTWNTSPAIEGAVASLTTPSTLTPFNFDVTTQVGAHYAGTNTGFLVRDSVSNNSNGNQQQIFVSREGAVGSRPELILTFS